MKKKLNHMDLLTEGEELIKKNITHIELDPRLENLINNKDVLVLGDTNHGISAISNGVIDLLNNLPYGVIKHFAYELPTNSKISKKVEEFNSSGDIIPLEDILNMTRTPIRSKDLLLSAQNNNIKIHFIDSEAEFDDKKRGVKMGEKISDIAKNNPNEKIIAFVGYSHLSKEEIPKILKKRKLNYTQLGIMAKGQPKHDFGMSFNLPSKMGSTNIIHENELGNGAFVKINNYDEVSGYILFPRDSLIRNNENKKTLIFSSKNLDIAYKKLTSGAVMNLLSKGKDDKTPFGDEIPLVIDFSSKIFSSVYDWPETNLHKIFIAVNEIKNLKTPQKIYLGTLLENYVRRTLNSKGSIIKIEYSPKLKQFGVDLLNTLEKEYDPNEEYGSTLFHRNVSMKELEKKFGFIDFFDNISEIETNILPNTQKEDSNYKLMILSLAYNQNPKMIKHISNEIRIFKDTNTKDHNNYLLNIDFENFELNPIETKLVNFDKKWWEFLWGSDMNVCVLGYNKINETLYKKKDINKFLKEYNITFDELSESGSIIFPIKDEILENRVNLNYISEKKINPLINNLERRIIIKKKVLNSFLHFFEKTKNTEYIDFVKQGILNTEKFFLDSSNLKKDISKHYTREILSIN